MLAITVVLVASAAVILLSVASIGGFDPSERAISDPPEGTVTQSVENPARPEHPGFPPPTTATNNDSLALPSAGVNFNSLVDQGLLKSSTAVIAFLAISK